MIGEALAPPSALSLPAKAALALEVVLAYARVRFLLPVVAFPRIVEVVRRGRVRHPRRGDDPLPESQRLGRIVERTLSPLPFDSRCLLRALVLSRLLARRGIESTFVLGVRARPSFGAHAWVELQGMPLLPTSPDFHRMLEL